MDVLYVGSGKSALLAPGYFGKAKTCAVNNAWSLFPSGTLDYWVHPSDFPIERHPPAGYRTKRVDFNVYQGAAEKSCQIMEARTSFQHHWIGYTIFFQGLHWIMHDLKPSRIFTLGFDHDYNPQKVDKWVKAGCPAPHNRFNEERPKDVLAWADQFFQGLESDSFYGHGTPDPLRLGEEEMKTFFKRAEEVADRLGIELYNLSGVSEGLNTFKHANSISETV